MQNQLFEGIDLTVLNLQQRNKVAKDPNTSHELLELLSADTKVTVRCSVAENPNCPIKILEKLATDDYCDVRMNVGYNSNSTSEIIDILAKDDDPCVRASAASHPNCLTLTIEKLAEDVDSFVRKCAREHHKFKNIIYRIIKFARNEHGFWNEPEWHSHYESALLSYNRVCTDPTIGAVLFMVDHEDYSIINSHNMDSCELVYDFCSYHVRQKK